MLSWEVSGLYARRAPHITPGYVRPACTRCLEHSAFDSLHTDWSLRTGCTLVYWPQLGLQKNCPIESTVSHAATHCVVVLQVGQHPSRHLCSLIGHRDICEHFEASQMLLARDEGTPPW